MATQYLLGEDGARLPDGIVLAHTLHGEPDHTVTHAHTAASGGLAVVPIGDDGIEYIGDRVAVVETPVDRSKRCVGNDNTCMGWRISGSDLCSGHAGKLRRP